MKGKKSLLISSILSFIASAFVFVLLCMRIYENMEPRLNTILTAFIFALALSAAFTCLVYYIKSKESK